MKKRVNIRKVNFSRPPNSSFQLPSFITFCSLSLVDSTRPRHTPYQRLSPLILITQKVFLSSAPFGKARQILHDNNSQRGFSTWQQAGLTVASCECDAAVIRSFIIIYLLFSSILINKFVASEKISAQR